MEAKELRVGNLVAHGHSLTTVVVESISASGINLVAGDGPGLYPEFEYGDLSGIPIRPEWLKALGFSPKLDDGRLFTIFFCDKCNLTIGLLTGGQISIVFRDYLDSDGELIPFDIHYVHQLQNLYFALTGEELEVTNG